DEARDAFLADTSRELEHRVWSEPADPLTRLALHVFDELVATRRPPEDVPAEFFATGWFRGDEGDALGVAADLEQQLERVRTSLQEVRRELGEVTGELDGGTPRTEDRTRRFTRDPRQAARRIRYLETQAAEGERQRRRANRLRDELAGAHESQRRLQDWMGELLGEVNKLLRSRRWRIGSALGDAIDRASPRRSRSKVADRIREVLDEFAAWKEAQDEELRRKRAQRGARHRPLEPSEDTAAAVVQRATEIEGAGAPRGLSAEEDRDRRRERYRRWVSEVEPEGRLTGPLVQPHVLIAPVPGRDVQEPAPAFHQIDQLRRTLTSLVGVASRVTCLGPFEGTLDELSRDIALDIDTDTSAASALRSTSAGWYMVVEPGDEVAGELPGALGTLVRGDRDPPGAVVCDHDIRAVGGSRLDPMFAPGWSPDLLLEHDYVGRGAVLHRASVLEAGTEPTDVSACLLELAGMGREIGKIDRVLVHHHPERGDVTQRRRAAVQRTERLLDHLDPVGQPSVRDRPTGPRVSYRLEAPPRVSIIVPFRDRVDLLEPCVTSVLRWSTYPDYELLLVDNASEEPDTAEYLSRIDDERVRILRYDREFNFSELNNWAVERARGDVIIFLNNDTQVVTHDWIEELVGYAVQPGVGMVGGLLHLRDGRIQHAGVAIGLQGLAGHVFAGAHEAHLPRTAVHHARNWSAVTAACAAVRRDRFEAIGGFDGSFEVTGSDVDLGLRLRDDGFRNVVNPSVRLFHFEKQSRAGLGVAPIDVRRSLVAYRADLRRGDPYWNSNLSLDSPLALPALAPGPTFADRRMQALRSIHERTPYVPDDSETEFLERFDASASDLEENRAVLRRFEQERELPLDRVTFFLPAFDHIYRGGIHTVMRIADHLARTRGTRTNLVMVNAPNSPISVIEQQISTAFPDLDLELTVLADGEDLGELEPSDAGICTLWTSAYHLMRWSGCRGKFYLVQDYEPQFYAAGSISGLIEQTYRFGFPGIANTQGVAESYRRYGNPTYAFTPGIDRTVFHPEPSSMTRDRLRIVFYGRPGNPRNAFELGTRALREVRKRHGDAVEILSAGAEFDEIALGLDEVLTNLGVLPDIGAVADLYRSCDIGVVLMFSKHPSYQPLEYMASGCATVTNVNEANDWLLRDRENAVLAPATVTGLADSIDLLVQDPSLRRKIVDNGLSTVEELDWEPALEGIARFLGSGAGGR
ncbi:MAG: glycosyltransferase, partial [Actinobacteria bacterium]|nr:glycosyltransferase [Actinomycetota bacterium]